MQPSHQILSWSALDLIINRQPLIVTTEMAVTDAIALMSKQESSCAVVVQNSQVAGVLTERDVLHLAASGRELAKLKISEVATRPVMTLTKSSSGDVSVALSLFSEHQPSHLPIVDPLGELIGIVSSSHIYQVLARQAHLLSLEKDHRQLQQIEENLRLRDRAIAASRNGIVISDARLPDLPLIYINSAFELMTGYSASEVLGKSCRFLQGEDKNQAELDTLRTALKTGTHCIVVLRNYRKDGTMFWNELSISPIYDSDGNLTHFIGIQTDITERKRAEQELQQAKEQIRAVLDGVPGLVSWIGSDLRYIGVNQHLAKIFKHPPEAFLGQEVGFLECSPGFRELMRQFFASPMKEISQEVDTEVNGNYRSYLIAAQKYNYDQAAFSVGIDITVRKRTEEQLRATTSRLTALIKNLQAGILVKDEVKRVVLINQEFCNMFGIAEPPLALVGQDFSKFAEQHKYLFIEPTEFLQHHYQILQTKKVVRNQELRLVDGRTFERDYVPIFVEGNYCGHFWMYRDITERKQAEMALLSTQEELRHALTKEKELNDLKSRFVSMTSHEFRTPLSTILSSAELLEHYRHKWTEEKQLVHLHRIQICVKQMNEMLNEILVIGKAEAGKLDCNPELLDLCYFCRQLVEELQLSAHNQHAIAFLSQGECTKACLDEKLLRHILSNLLSNAIKYSPSGSTIKFILTCENDQAIFQVQDQGIGIPLEDKQRLFESFHRATNVGNIPGTGLGLTIVKRCVDVHGGQIQVESTVGVGTSFTVILPLSI